MRELPERVLKEKYKNYKDASFYRYDIGGDCDCGWDERRELF